MDKKIRLLFTISNFNTAGSGKVIYDLVTNLNPDKFEISIACGSDKGDYLKIFKSLDVKIYIHRTNIKIRPYFSFYKRLKPTVIFLKSNFDIVHSWYWSSDWSEILACRLAGVKHVYTKKSMGFSNRNWKIKSILTNFIITVNSDMRKLFPYKENQRLIPFGLDAEIYKASSRVESDYISNDTFHIITIANLVPIKGIEILIEAMLHYRNKKVSLTIVGNDVNSYSKHLKELVENYHLQDQITFTGKTLDVTPYFDKADLYIIPTKGVGEGMPMALVEAMCMGLVVLGSDIAGVNFVLKDFKNLLFRPMDLNHLIQKIEYVRHLTFIERQSLGQELRYYCKVNFSMDSFIKNHEQVYIKVLS